MTVTYDENKKMINTASLTSGKSPKERGCFQCSRRRIICDKAEPNCEKCLKKGIECSGLNRIRFAEGVARRGLLKGSKLPDISNNGAKCLPQKASFPTIRWNNEMKRRNKRKKDTRRDADQMSADPQGSGHQNLQPWIPPLSADARMLFSYFSTVIAPAMVVLDTVSNGYRELILSMAFEDEVLRRAVGVVAAQHLSRERPEIEDAAESGRAAIISRLRKDALSGTEDQVFSKFTWATLVVLLVGETVTGSEDYSLLVGMLLCVSANSRTQNEDTATTRFLQSQTNMFELLGSPLLGEHTGISAIQRLFKPWQDWLAYGLPADSERLRIIGKIQSCFSAASMIYIRRAKSEYMKSSSITDSDYNTLQYTTIQDIIKHLIHIPPHMHGAHALVWPCFVAGAESSDLGHRAFFVDYMERIYARTKFRNIPLAVESLKTLWASKGEKKWTQYLPECSKVLVM